MTGYTVGQLIRELQKYPKDDWVMLYEKGNTYEIPCTTISKDIGGVEPNVVLSNEKENYYDE